MERNQLNLFDSLIEDMRSVGMKTPPEKKIISVPDSLNILKNYMKFFIEKEGRPMVWLDEYNSIAEWLESNEGKGLFLHGACGRGKTIMVRYVLPAILLKHCGELVHVFNANYMKDNIDSVLWKKIISLDDIGTEELSIKYGQRRNAFAEIVDIAEKEGKLLIVSSNLDKDGLEKLYGVRILDRIIHITKRVAFNGESLRK